jgi:hypothetical protein
MMIADSSVLGMAFGSAGETKVLRCVANNRRSGCCPRNPLICSSRAVAGDLPEGSRWRTTSNIFAFISHFLFNPALYCLAFHKAHDAEEDSNRPGLRFLRVFNSGRDHRFRVVLQFLVTTRTRIRVEEIAELNTTVGTF